MDFDESGDIDVGRVDKFPAYRVFLWQQTPRPPKLANSPVQMGMMLTAWRVTGARDVREVLEWVDAERGDRTFGVYAEVADIGTTATDEVPDHVRLVRLAGYDPVDSSEPNPDPYFSDPADASAEQQRRAERRRQ
jgi:hypothetical protein